MKLALELFKGTGSIGKALIAHGFHVDSLDMDPKCNATWTSDILAWDGWRQIEPGTYDFIWASPPCQQYSRARTTAKTPRNLELADSIVARTLEIIRYLKPRGWLMENPQTGLLKTREVVEGLPYRDVCYCRYSDGERHMYRKQTRLWGSAIILCHGNCAHSKIRVPLAIRQDATLLARKDSIQSASLGPNIP